MDDFKKRVIEYRREFHKFPELSGHEKRTSQKVAKFLKEENIQVEENIGGNGVVGYLEGDKPGKTIGVRADMDALPIEEKNDLHFKSQNKGVMHACGHDAHMAIVLGAAKLLSERKNQFNGQIKLVFQPSEEKPPGGAKQMIEDGVLQNPEVEAMLGLHVSPEFTSGTIIVPEGPVMAGSDKFTLKVQGSGGHGARPEQSDDTFLVTSHFGVMLQNIINRKFDPHRRPVISIGKVNGGTAHNIIPDEITIIGTVRYFNEGAGRYISDKIEQLIASITKLYGGGYELDYEYGYPVTINDQKIVEIVRETASNLQEIVNLKYVLQPAFVADDFGYFSEKVPSCYLLFGTKNEAKGTVNSLHSDKFILDEDVLPKVSKLLAQSLINFLSK